MLDRYGDSHLVLAAGTYTIEATTWSGGDTGTYSVWVRRFDLTPCVQDLGTLDSATASLSGSGLISQDADCVSSQRDPDSADTFFARRHTFTLAAESSVSYGSGGVGAASLLISGSSL